MEEQAGTPRVTALVVSRNDAGGLRACLQKLEASIDRDPLEILVIDDASDDGSAGVSDEFPDVISLRMSKRVGWTRAANIALRTAKGDLVLLMNSNVLVEPDTISRLANRLESSNDAGAVCPFAPQWYSFPAPEALMRAALSGELADPQPVEPSAPEMAVDYPRGAPIMMKRGFLRGMNYLDQRFGHHWGDLELCSRVLTSGKPILMLPGVPVTYQPVVREESTLMSSDALHGAATWIGLHKGTVAGLRARIGAALNALGRGEWSVITGVLSGTKIDGKQDW